MELLKGYQKGVNLGGWISQYWNTPEDHFDTFITEADLKRIAEWGADHVRLPVDHTVLLVGDDDRIEGVGLKYIDDCVSWCQKYGLNLILDLHSTKGYAFYELERNALFENESLQELFLNIWRTFVKRYQHLGDAIIFELLNEIVEPDSTRWNLLSKRAVQAIREISPDAKIIIGGNNYNSLGDLPELDVIDDKNVIYTFHCYEPLLFTHQHAYWVEEMKDIRKGPIDYPSSIEEYSRIAGDIKRFRNGFDVASEMGPAYFEKMFEPALKFMKDRNVEIYCGEFGVITGAPLDATMRWFRDYISVLKKYNIGYAVWVYKKTDFGLLDLIETMGNEDIIDLLYRS
jgi:endoglucanase